MVFPRVEFIPSSPEARGDPRPSHSSSALDSVLGEGMDEDSVSVLAFSPLEWSLLCSKVGFGTKGHEEKTGIPFCP